MGGIRRAIGVFLLAGGVVLVLTGAIATTLGVVALLKAQEARVPVFFSAGQEVEVPSRGLLELGPLVVYASRDVDGSPTQELACQAVSPSGYERMVGGYITEGDLETDRGTLKAQVSSDTWRPGDKLTCSGPGAVSVEPLALAVGRSSAVTASIVMLVFGVAALLFGAACLAVGVGIRRRNA